MKIIFLDYDGVVNNLIFHKIDGEPDFYAEDRRVRMVNDFQAVAWLNKICREFNCKVVVTSTWRTRKDYKDCLYRAGFNGTILDKTPFLDKERGLEIYAWLSNNLQNYDIDDFIILDDDTDMGGLNVSLNTNKHL